MQNDLGKFWVVTRPTVVSTLEDICFCTDVNGIMLQALGGLRPDQVVLVTQDEQAARKLADTLLTTQALTLKGE